MTTHTLISNLSSVPEALTSDLIFTYNTLTGSALTRFATRADAERRTSLAISLNSGTAIPKAVPATEAAEAKTATTTKAQKAKVVKEKAPLIAKEDRTPRGPQSAHTMRCKLLTATVASPSDAKIVAMSFRGQILSSIIASPGISKADLIAKHGAYTADVVCKFKRLGFITETFNESVITADQEC